MMTLQLDSRKESSMRTIIDLPDPQLDGLARICQRDGISRAEVIRRAVAAYLDSQPTEEVSAFGLWKHRGEDGLDYQDRIRREWQERQA
jgi:hypothetical protein